MSPCQPSGRCSHPTRHEPRTKCCAWCGRAAASASPTGRPRGSSASLFKVIGRYLPPPAGLASPALWGTEPYVVKLFGTHAADVRCVRRHFNFRYRSAAHWLQIFRDYYGPTHKAFAAVDAATAQAMAKDITGLLERLNVGGPDSLVVPGEYLEAIVVKC